MLTFAKASRCSSILVPRVAKNGHNRNGRIRNKILPPPFVKNENAPTCTRQRLLMPIHPVITL